MSTPIRIRRYKPGEERVLFEVYHSAIHRVASEHYTPVKIQNADLQSNGYIDHCFVSGACPRQGVGTALMTHLLAEAQSLGLGELTSDLGRAAQAFYEKFGFSVVEKRNPELRGVVIPIAFMRRSLVRRLQVGDPE